MTDTGPYFITIEFSCDKPKHNGFQIISGLLSGLFMTQWYQKDKQRRLLLLMTNMAHN